MKPIVIIGTGLAGYGVARELRKLDRATPLLIISADDGRAYSKPMLSNALARGKTAETLATADADAMATQLDAGIRTWTRISAIDPNNHQIRTDDGARIDYSKLVLALGAQPFRAPIEGDSDALLSVNNLIDYGRFRDHIDKDPRIAILGGGLIGCEFANDLAASGYEVDIIDRHPWPLGRMLPEVVGRELQNGLESLGVRWHGNTSTEHITREGQGVTLRLSNGHLVSAGTALSAIGFRAHTELASAAGLAVDKAICVDRFLQSSAPDVYALGDCAEVEGRFLPFVMPLMHCARALARTLAGTPTPVVYPVMPVVVKTPVYPISLVPPPPGLEGEWHIEANGSGIDAQFFDNRGRLAGFALGGDKSAKASALAKQIEDVSS